MDTVKAEESASNIFGVELLSANNNPGMLQLVPERLDVDDIGIRRSRRVGNDGVERIHRRCDGRLFTGIKDERIWPWVLRMYAEGLRRVDSGRQRGISVVTIPFAV